MARDFCKLRSFVALFFRQVKESPFLFVLSLCHPASCLLVLIATPLWVEGQGAASGEAFRGRRTPQSLELFNQIALPPGQKKTAQKIEVDKANLKALDVDPELSALAMGPLLFKYDFSLADELLFAKDTKVKEKDLFFVELGSKSEAEEIINGDSSSLLYLYWPKELVHDAYPIKDQVELDYKIHAINQKGEIFWQSNIDQSAFEKIQTQLQKLKRKNSPQLFLSSAGASELFQHSGIFKICVMVQNYWPKEIERSQSVAAEESNFIRFCSRRMKWQKQKQNSKLLFAKENLKRRLLLNKKPSPLKGEMDLAKQDHHRLFLELSNGSLLEWKVKLPSPELRGIKRLKNNFYEIVGFKDKPNQVASYIVPEEEKGFLGRIGWLPTIGDLKTYWRQSMALGSSAWFLSGHPGGLFLMQVELKEPPSKSLSTKIEERSLKSTYLEYPSIRGRHLKGVELRTNQFKVDDDGENFTWTLGPLSKGEEKEFLLLSKEGDNAWGHRYSVYRGFASELSLRMSGILTANEQASLLGEVAYSHWFEEPFGRNYWLSHQRWGIAARSFSSLSEIKEKGGEGKLRYEASILDLKYRLTPGVWGREESWGLVLSYQNQRISPVTAPLVGGGFFWARSMPKIFDDLFNYFIFMRYPKWVDMDFTYYPSSLDSRHKVGSGNYNLNFHGKVLWGENVFGEAGFGVRAFDVVDKKVNQQALFQSFYGTLGLGISF